MVYSKVAFGKSQQNERNSDPLQSNEILWKMSLTVCILYMRKSCSSKHIFMSLNKFLGQKLLLAKQLRLKYFQSKMTLALSNQKYFFKSLQKYVSIRICSILKKLILEKKKNGPM